MTTRGVHQGSAAWVSGLALCALTLAPALAGCGDSPGAQPAKTAQPARGVAASDVDRLAAMEARLAALDSRVARLENPARPAADGETGGKPGGGHGLAGDTAAIATAAAARRKATAPPVEMKEAIRRAWREYGVNPQDPSLQEKFLLAVLNWTSASITQNVSRLGLDEGGVVCRYDVASRQTDRLRAVIAGGLFPVPEGMDLKSWKAFISNLPREIVDRAYAAAVRAAQTGAAPQQKAQWHLLFHHLRPTEPFEAGEDRSLVNQQMYAVTRVHDYLLEQGLILDWNELDMAPPPPRGG